MFAVQRPKPPRQKRSASGRFFEKPVETLFFLSAGLSVLAVVLITVFLFLSGVPAMAKIGLGQFLFGMRWEPSLGLYGILPMIVSSILTTALAVALATLIGVLTAVFLVEVAPNWLARLLRPAINLLAAIPSVVYGFFGMLVVVPAIRNAFSTSQNAIPGYSVLSVVIILTMMILPIIITLSENALRSLPANYKEASLALGATPMRTMFRVLIPAARSGIMAAIVLGMGRAMGETMAVIMVAGNAANMPTSLLSMVRTLTGNVALEMNYASGIHREALFATGVVLFVFIMIINIVLNVLTRKGNADKGE